MAETNEYRQQRLQNMAALKDLGFEPFGMKFEHTDIAEARENFADEAEANLAGRLMTIRRMGKMNFATINDGTGKFQLIFKRDELTETLFAGFKLLNLGDIIGAKGKFFTTQKGEKSLIVKEWVLLAKALEQPPEKVNLDEGHEITVPVQS